MNAHLNESKKIPGNAVPRIFGSSIEHNSWKNKPYFFSNIKKNSESVVIQIYPNKEMSSHQLLLKNYVLKYEMIIFGYIEL